jgi:hypothetical protein
MKRKTFRLAVAGAGLAALAATFVLATSAAVSDPATIAAIPDIPAGDTVTLSNATFGGTGNCPADNLTYGYQLGAGAPVAVATGGTGGASAGCNPAAGATIGAVAATMSFDIYLTDNHSGCSGATYDSDGGGPGGADHSLVTEENSTTFDVSITDCDEGTQTTNTRGPAQLQCHRDQQRRSVQDHELQLHRVRAANGVDHQPVGWCELHAERVGDRDVLVC